MEKYCTECGTKLITRYLENEGDIPFCETCGQFRFPKFNAAVIMIVVNEATGRIMLIKQYGGTEYILVAGYISLGECAEDAVRREVREETGMEVERIRFNRTQYYEPSNALMCNFTAFVRDDSELHVNSEIDSFTWFTPDEARQNIRKGSLAQYFLNMYLDETESMEKGKETG